MQSNSSNPYPDSNPDQEETTSFRDSSRRLVLIGMVLLALGAAALPGARPAYRWFKSQRARSFVKQGEDSMAAGQLDVAANKVRLALELAPGDPDALRLAARCCSKRGLSEGLNYWQMLLGRPEASRQDVLDYLDLALLVNRLDLTGPQLNELLRKDPHDREILRRIIQHFRQSNRPAGAILAGREWLRQDPTDPEAQFVLGTLLHQGGTNDAQIAEGRGLLWSVALGQGPYRHGALSRLVPDAALTRAENQLLLKSLIERSTNGVADRLAIATVRLRLDPASAPQLAAELVRETPAELPALQRSVIANWLIEHQMGDAALSLLPMESARTNPALLSLRLRAAADLNRWDELAPFLESTNDAAIPPALKHCFLAQRDVKQGRLQNVPGHFENALAACSNRLSEIEFVAAFAEALQQPSSAIIAYKRMLDSPPVALEAARKILALLAPLDDLHTRRETLRKVAALLPGETNVRVEEAYVAFVLGERLPEAKSALTAMLRKDPSGPTSFMIRSTLALAELRGGNAPAALSLLEGVDTDWSTVEPRWQAIYIAVLGANLQRDAARQMARRVDRSGLKTEERQLVEPWL